jgi:hypothetical protein
MTDIAMHVPAPALAPPAVFRKLVDLLRARYAMGDALEPTRARDVVMQVVYDMLTDTYLAYTERIGATEFVPLGRGWDHADIVSPVMNELIVSHRRSLDSLADAIVERSLAGTSNKIFLDTSEIPPLLAIAVVVGHEIRSLLPETAAAWIEEIES